VLIADEATTALDVTIQKGILDLLQRLQAERGMAMIIVSHDLSVVAGRTDDVIVMYGGRIVDRRPTAKLFEPPMHPYTRALSLAIPRLDMNPHTRLPALGGNPPSVFDPVLSAEETEVLDRERWSTIADEVADEVPDVQADVVPGEEIAAVGVLAAEQQAGTAEGGDVQVSEDTIFEQIARDDAEEGRGR
jgi:peptide/nickel transport system ATP-binding protein